MSAPHAAQALPNTQSGTLGRTSLRWARAVAILLVLIAAVRIVTTHRVFTQTFDEGAHIACGLEWLSFGTYTYEPQHPPLSRIAVALGPWLQGARPVERSMSDGLIWREGNRALYEGSYADRLAAARLGTLPFFGLAAAVVWFWTRRTLGIVPALFGLFLFTTLPPVLAHGGLATTDMAATAGIGAALLAVWLWWTKPSRRTAVLFGLCLAGAVTSKFTSFLFLPTAGLLLLLASSQDRSRAAWRARATTGLVAAAVSLAAIWAVYRFSLAPIVTPETRPHSLITKVFGATGAGADLGNAVIEAPVPAPELFRGLVWSYQHNRAGHDSYLFGRYNIEGSPLFFPVVLLVKTPLPFLLLVALGAGVVLYRPGKQKAVLAVLMAALGILGVCLGARINLGVRHILPIYPLLSVVAAAGAAWLWQRGRVGQIVLGVLMVGQLGASWSAQPDYLAFFNTLAGQHPDQILVESDLDWGQDVGRLAAWAREHHVPSLTVGLFTSADLERHGLPPFRLLRPYQPATGWVAISLTEYRLKGGKAQSEMGRREPGYAWLDRYQPVARVGQSILVYDIPAMRD